MRLNLNRWQRGLLLLAAGGMMVATLAQGSDYGFDDGVGWVFPVALSVGLAFVAFSSSSQEQPRSKSAGKSQTNRKPDSKSKPRLRLPLQPEDLVECMGYCSNELFMTLPTPTATITKMLDEIASSPEAVPVERRFLTESLLFVRSAVYGYVMVMIAAVRMDPEFNDSSMVHRATESFNNILKKGWLRRYGHGVEDFPNEQSRSQFIQEGFKATIIHGAVMDRMLSKDPAPFEPLFKYIDLNSSASVSELEKRYGPVTRDLLKTITFGRQKYW